MSTTLTPDVQDADAVAERLLQGTLAFTEFLSIHLGLELGLYDALQGAGATTSAQLARRTGVAERYAREWLEHQTVAGYLVCVDPTAEAEAREFELPSGVATALLDPTSDAYLGPLAHAAGGAAAVIREVATAYRTGGGVAFGDYGHELRHGLAALNGASYDGQMGAWLATMPDVDARLRSAHAPRILDVGCGTGRSTLALARLYPSATVRGVDMDADSIAEAREAAARAGMAHRVTFQLADATSVVAEDPYDLVTVFEALHDMGDPVGALRAMHAAVAADAAVYVVDERVADHFTPDADEFERLQYGFSVLHCLPATMAEDPVIAAGTVLRRPTLEAWATEVGFERVEVLDIEDPFWRHYRLHPGR